MLAIGGTNFVGDSNDGAVHFNFSGRTKEGKSAYKIIIDVYTDNHVDIVRRDSLLVRVDGKESKFSATMEPTRDAYHEHAEYLLPNDQLIQRISASDDVKIRLIGRTRYVNVQYEKDNFNATKRFVKACLQPVTSKAKQ